MFWKSVRMLCALLIAYLLQTTFLPYLRIGGVMPDVLIAVVCATAIHFGPYLGLLAGLCAALLMEVMGGDVPGLTAVFYALCGLYGAFMPNQFRRRLPQSMAPKKKKRWEQMMPAILVGVYSACKEGIYVIYFYLSGVDVRWIHIYWLCATALLSALVTMAGYPLYIRWLDTKPMDTWLGKRIKRMAEKRKAQA